VTIVFLIMSAVWTQLGKLNVAQDNPHGPPTDTPTQAALVMTMTSHNLELLLDGRLVGTFTAQQLPGLGAALGELKKQLPDQSAVTIQSDDDVTYEDIVRVMDLCVAAELPSVTLNPRG
jgi:biopolymer transport protein TolR